MTPKPKKQQKCRKICANGKKCKFPARIYGYCTQHFLIELRKVGKLNKLEEKIRKNKK